MASLPTVCLKFSRLGTTDVRREGKGRLKSKELNLLGWLRSVLQKLDSGRRRAPSFDGSPTNVAFPFRFYLFIGKTDLNIDKRNCDLEQTMLIPDNLQSTNPDEIQPSHGCSETTFK